MFYTDVVAALNSFVTNDYEPRYYRSLISTSNRALGFGVYYSLDWSYISTLTKETHSHCE